ncbi:ATP-binding protein [Streptomyces sp. NPDC057638]|uniref:ATP-binding protein n=1 Tax=Streptomyces sp. NPDC057638 TaxID=3346190 RepID=UPI0036B519EE
MARPTSLDAKATLSLTLTVRPDELTGVRRRVIQSVRADGFGAIADDVGLVVGELLTNVHEHAEGVCEVEIHRAGARLVVRVSDTVPTPPTTLRHRPDGTAESGRGLLIVDALTECWHTTLTPTGKVITCVFRIPSGR